MHVRRAGAAGLIVSVNRIVTKAMMRDVGASTLLFFGVSIAFVVVCCAAFHATRSTEFVRFYVSVCRSSAVSDDQRAIMRPSNEPAAAGEEVSLVSVFCVERERVSNASHAPTAGFSCIERHGSTAFSKS